MQNHFHFSAKANRPVSVPNQYSLDNDMKFFIPYDVGEKNTVKTKVSYFLDGEHLIIKLYVDYEKREGKYPNIKFLCGIINNVYFKRSIDLIIIKSEFKELPEINTRYRLYDTPNWKRNKIIIDFDKNGVPFIDDEKIDPDSNLKLELDEDSCTIPPKI